MSASVATSERAKARLALGEAAVLTLAQAVALLPGDDKKVRAWLRAEGLVKPAPWGDGEIVRWGDVLRALGDDGAPAPPARRPSGAGGSLPRETL